MKFLEKLFMSLIEVGVVCAGLYLLAVYAVPAGWRSFQAGEAAKVTVHAQAGAISSDTASANRQQINCSAELNHAADAFKAIAKASQVQPVAAGQGQPLILGPQISGIVQ